jgi:D-alanyl-D-alanine carboxypeptidase
MALRDCCPQIGRVVRLATAALISGSALFLACAPASAHHYRHMRHVWHYGQSAHYGHSGHYIHYARAWRGARHAVAAVPFSPAFSAIVVDANSGRTLYAADEDGLRHPASITKVMTLYLLFEQLESGAMTLQTRIPISEHAAAQEPSKLGVEPGETISVEDAIKAVVTRSANDVAVAIAEAIGRDEDRFAEMMTEKAHALGMSNTLYRNASGLPNDEQVTTARDLTVLGRSLEERFPRYFRYFSTREFQYAGEVIGNHNHLLGRVDGVDGIKTGYTRASGFNLLTSVHRGGRSLVAVVMGGRTAGARDRIMENLISDHVAEASTARTASMVADASGSLGRAEEPAHRAAPQEAPPARPHAILVTAGVSPREARTAEPIVSEGDNAANDDDSASLRVAAVAPTAKPAPSPLRSAVKPSVPAPAPPPQDQRTPGQLGWAKGSDDGAAHPKAKITLRAVDTPRPPVERPNAQKETAVAARAPATVQDDDASDVTGGWAIQVGASADLAKANALLIRAREENRSTLASAKPITQKVRKGEDTFYRARFAGLDSASAESACRSLKRNGFSCFTARD